MAQAVDPASVPGPVNRPAVNPPPHVPPTTIRTITTVLPTPTEVEPRAMAHTIRAAGREAAAHGAQAALSEVAVQAVEHVPEAVAADVTEAKTDMGACLETRSHNL